MSFSIFERVGGGENEARGTLFSRKVIFFCVERELPPLALFIFDFWKNAGILSRTLARCSFNCAALVGRPLWEDFWVCFKTLGVKFLDLFGLSVLTIELPPLSGVQVESFSEVSVA